NVRCLIHDGRLRDAVIPNNVHYTRPHSLYMLTWLPVSGDACRGRTSMTNNAVTAEFPGGVGVLPLDQVRRMSGIDFLTRIAAGELPAPPIGETLGFRLTTVEPGRVVFTGQPCIAHYNPIGTVHGGWT